jgi:uncharacterized protein YjbI with pentapeptide repeats
MRCRPGCPQIDCKTPAQAFGVARTIADLLAPSHALINHAFAVAYKPPKSVKELLERYSKGERDFHRAILRAVNLFDENLSGANLSNTNFFQANLFGTNLFGTNLTRANLSTANLSEANLSGANLSGADLVGTNLTRANLTRANLTRANLSDANLSQANLSEVNLTSTTLANSHLGGVSLVEFCKAHKLIKHDGPSSIDFESITRSLHAPNLEDFLVRAGIPHIAAQYMIESAQAVKGSVWDMMQSTFICYGRPDEAFARKLYEALHSNGVRTFFYPEHAEPGEKHDPMMRKGVNEHDRVIVICSKDSLDRKGVLNEIVETLAREARDGGEAYLIPVRIDDYIYSGWKPARADIAPALRDDRVVADFTGAMTDQAKFDAAFSKVLRALRVKNTAPTSP